MSKKESPKPAPAPMTPEEMVRQLRAMREQIPDLVIPPEPDPPRRSVNPDAEFLNAVIETMEAMEAKKNAAGLTAESGDDV